MILVPVNLHARFRRTLKAMWDRPNLLGSIAVIGGIASTVGVFFGGFSTETHVSPALYCLVVILFLFLGYFIRSSSILKKHSQKDEIICHHFHNIAESLRELMCLITSNLMKLSGTETKENSKKWAERYIDSFKNKSKEISEELNSAFVKIGYNVKGVCIKYYNSDKHELHVIARAGRKGEKPARDMKEKESENPFFRLLMGVHLNHDTLIQGYEARRIRRNRKIGNPRFLAIGDIRLKGLPKIFTQIMASYAKESGQDPPEGFDETQILYALRNRSKAYDSCLGMIICNKQIYTETKDEKEIEKIMGFIGIDSPDKCAWDSLEPDHMHLVAGVADTLYPLMEIYKLALQQYSRL